MARSAALKLVDEEQPAGPLYADIDEVREFAESIPGRYLECRDLNHNWKPFAVEGHRNGGWLRTQRCTRCKAKRYQHVSDRGLIVSTRYEHPKGYLHKGMGRITGDAKGALRLVAMTRGDF